MFIYSTKKALHVSAFFIVAIFFYSGLASADCRVKKYDETVSVLRVNDGDTLVLTDKRKIRLIGINTPELGRYPKKPEAFALQAKRFVEAALKSSKKIHLKYGVQAKDRYGRVLAHLFLNNGQNLSAMLLENGLASAIVVPPNMDLAGCYFRVEKKARANKRNLWAHAGGQYLDANRLKKTGYALIQGSIIRVGHSRDSVWLQLAKKFTIRIKHRDLKYFPQLDLKNLSLAQLQNKKIYARGWVYKWKKEFYLQIRHPYMMQFGK